MGVSSVKVWIGFALAAIGIGAIAAASSSSSKPAPAPVPTGPLPWTIKQGERYRVTVTTSTTPSGGGGFNSAIDWTPIVQAGLDAVAPAEYHVVSSTVPLATPGSLVFVVDALGPTHNEPSGSFTSFQYPSPMTVTTIDDLGLTPPATAGA